MSPTVGRHFVFQILISECILFKNRIYYKMHHEKLYKLYKLYNKAYFNCGWFRRIPTTLYTTSSESFLMVLFM